MTDIRPGWIRGALCVAVIALTLTGCSSSKHSGASSTGAAVLSAGPADPVTKAAITKSFTTFFDGTASLATRLGYLQNASTFQAALSSQANTPLIKQTSATVTTVTLTSAATAKVIYTVALANVPALNNQTGIAVLIGGSWKVAATTFCQILTLAGPLPSACTQASVTAVPS